MLDTIIVGGGPAGLSAALVLGRCLRQVVVCDAGHPRNEPAKTFNGYLSRDGSNPAEFLAVSREQLRRYDTVEFRRAVVADVERSEGELTAILESGERLAARTLLIATGVVDKLPQIENFRQFYGKTAHSCPYATAGNCAASRSPSLARTRMPQSSRLNCYSGARTLCYAPTAQRPPTTTRRGKR